MEQIKITRKSIIPIQKQTETIEHISKTMEVDWETNMDQVQLTYTPTITNQERRKTIETIMNIKLSYSETKYNNCK